MYNAKASLGKKEKSNFPRNRIIILTAALLVVCMTLIVYLPALQNDFVNWHPLTLFSHALDYAVWGLDPWGHHLVNIFFHLLNSFLVFILAIRLFSITSSPGDTKGKIVIGITTALLFGIHPLHVESVANKRISTEQLRLILNLLWLTTI